MRLKDLEDIYISTKLKNIKKLYYRKINKLFSLFFSLLISLIITDILIINYQRNLSIFNALVTLPRIKIHSLLHIEVIAYITR